MAKQTINIGASANDGTGTPLRTSFDYCNLNFTELYTAVGPSGNNIVCPGSATITGDLTVDASTLKVDSTNDRVGIGTASPATALDVNGDITQRNGSGTIIGNIQNSAGLYDVKASANVTGLQLSTAAATPIVFALNNVAAMRLNATGLGVGVVPSAGKGALQLSSGINFPATQVASSDVNTLDDYEEGTFTATLNSGTFSAQVFKYTKIGNMVTIFFDVIVGTGGGTQITNLPYTAAGTVANGIYTNAQDYAAGTTSPVVVVGASGTIMYFRTVGDNVAFSAMTLTAAAALSGSISYYV